MQARPPGPGYIPQHAFTISMEHIGWAAEVLRTYGVVIVTDVVKPAEARAHARELVRALCLCGDKDTLDPTDLSSWTFSRLPPVVGCGKYRSCVGSLKAVWDVRTLPNVRTAFEEAYSGLRRTAITDLTVSVDGLNVHPPKGSYYEPGKLPWAELDVGVNATDDPDAVYRCVEGLVVLNETSGGMCVSPRSHLVYSELRELLFGVHGTASDTLDVHNDVGTWLRVDARQFDKVEAVLKRVGGVVQVPIVPPVGSMVMWLSSTLHSDKLQDLPKAGGGAVPSSSDGFTGPLPNWIVAVPVCMRPMAEVRPEDLARRRNAVRRGLSTTACGNRMYDKIPKSQDIDNYCEAVQDTLATPHSGSWFMHAKLAPAVRRLLYAPDDEHTPWTLVCEHQKKRK